MSIPSILSLHFEKNIKASSRKYIFDIVLKKCCGMISNTNKTTGKTFIIFEVPCILPDYPYYDQKECILYLFEKFKKYDYYTQYIPPYYLYIDWGSIDKENSNKLKLLDNIKSYDIEYVTQK